MMSNSEISAIDGITDRLQARASSLKKSAQSMETVAMKRETEAAEEVAALKYMRQAQEELNAYAANFEALTTVESGRNLNQVVEQFPREAAELHALIDHSLSRSDAISVRLASQDTPQLAAVSHDLSALALRQPRRHSRSVARKAVRGAPILSQRSTAIHSQAQHIVHRAAMAATRGAKARPVAKASDARHGAPIPAAAARAAAPAGLAATAKYRQAASAARSSPSSDADALAQLRRVKSFARAAAAAPGGPHSAEAAALARALAGSPMQMLVQPGPLHGALPVRGGALRRSGTLWNPKALGWEDYEADVGDLSTAEVSGPPLTAPPSWREHPTRYSPSTWRKILLAQAAAKEAAAAAAADNSTDGAANATEAESGAEANATGAGGAGNKTKKAKWHPDNDVRLACNKTCQQAHTLARAREHYFMLSTSPACPIAARSLPLASLPPPSILPPPP